jgi:multicomponent Na+:H+ antiporter subunit E
MKRLIPVVVWLVIVWLGLWERLSVANVVGGILVATLLLMVFPMRFRRPVDWRIRPVAASWFTVFFIWKLVEASLYVAWEVVTPRNKINEGIVAIPIRGVSDGLITIVGNAISLTPGTVTLEVHEDPAVLYVHVLHLHDIEAVRHDVQHLELLAIKAFGSEEALDALQADLSPIEPSEPDPPEEDR